MNTFKILTYNIDGLPDYLDLKDLPWILKPIAWVYKLFKKTTIIKINDNKDTANNIRNISLYLSGYNFDLIGVQEDFNYHKQLMSYIPNYICGKVSEDFSLKKLFSKIEIWSYFPLPRFKSDGINLLMNSERIKNNIERIISWDKSNGYISHANDLLTHKGFRYYNITIDNKYDIDVYVLHMDADFYHPESCPDVHKDIEARKSQINQLVSFIKFNNSHNPIIIMGDTNSYDKYKWDADNIKYLIESINYNLNLHCEEAIPSNFKDCDRIFYINNDFSKYKLELEYCNFDLECDNFSDHKPLIANFKINE